MIWTSSLATLTGTACASAYDKAELANADGRFDEAENYYRRSMAEEEEEAPKAQRALAELLYKRAAAKASSDFELAEEFYRRTLEVDETYEDARISLARLWWKNSRREEALSILHFEGCRACGPLEAAIRVERAEQYVASGRGTQAIEDLTRALELEPASRTAIDLMAAFETEGDAELALEGAPLVMAVRVGEQGRLYGSVTSADVAEKGVGTVTDDDEGGEGEATAALHHLGHPVDADQLLDQIAVFAIAAIHGLDCR